MSDPQDQDKDLHDEQRPADALRTNKAEDQSPGEMLRAAREAHNYSVADLCAQTMLSRQTVAALEGNEFDRLSQPVFARGYYRKCAKVLDMDTEAVMAAYSAWAGEPVPRAASATAVNVVPEDVTPAKRRKFGVVLLIIVLLIALFLIYLVLPKGGSADDAGDGAGTINLTPETGMPAPDADAGTNDLPISLASSFAVAEVEPADSATAPDNEAAIEPVPNDMDGVEGAAPAGVDDPIAASEPAAADDTTSEPAVAASVLTLEFDERSWVEVRDATGEQLLVGIYETTTRTLEGVPPYSLTLGYAPGVDVRIGGEPVEFEVAGDNTARLRIDTSQ